MAVPTVTVISPASGHTGGGDLLQIMGSGFQLPPDPPLSGPAPPVSASMEILFGSGSTAQKGRSVAVVSSNRLFVRTPRSPLAASAPEGAVDVTIRNIDQAGVLVPGETVTVVGGFTYARPDINAVPNAELTRLVRTFIQMLKREVLPNVALTTSTDYADDPAATVAAIGELPALVLEGPQLRENRFYSSNASVSDQAAPFGFGAGYFATADSPHTVDLVFTIIGVTDNPIQELNLRSEMVSFVERNHNVEMRRDGEDGTSEVLQWEFDYEPGGDFSSTGVVNNANVRAFQGAVVIRGFDIYGSAPLHSITRELQDIPSASVQTPDGVTLQEEQTGITYQLGPSPGPPGQGDC